MTLRSVSVLLIAVVGALAVAAFTGSLLQARNQPGMAIRLWPSNSLALANLAGATTSLEMSRDKVAIAGNAAREALMLEPGNPVAARSVGILAALKGDEAAALRALSYGDQMSRRDVETQLALIELRVQQGDVAGALRHYDRALRTTQTIPVLLSTMITASSDPSIRRRVLGLLAARPYWRSAFLVQLIDEQTPPDTVFGFIAGLRLDRSDPYERQVLGAAIGKLVGQGRVAAAQRLLPPSRSMPRNGGFGQDNPFPPLDWALAVDANLNGDVEAGPGGHGPVLYMTARNGVSGEVGWQSLALAPGRYRLTSVAGDIIGDDASRPRLTIGCGVDGARALTALVLPDAPAAGRAVTGDIFVVDPACPVQRLAIMLPVSLDGTATRPWLDDIIVASVDTGMRSGSMRRER